MNRKSISLWGAAVAALLATGCAVKRFEYHPTTEIPPGPGMLSGEDGEFVLYSKRPQKGAAGADSVPDEYREFRDFQEFKRWKEANRDTPAWREFQEWREWKAYRAWKEREK